VRGMVEVARGLGKRTVAEFVEDEETLNLLAELGVDMAQGYYLDYPEADHPALQPRNMKQKQLANELAA